MLFSVFLHQSPSSLKNSTRVLFLTKSLICLILMNVGNIESIGYIHGIWESYHISIIIVLSGHFERIILTWLKLAVSTNRKPLLMQKHHHIVSYIENFNFLSFISHRRQIFGSSSAVHSLKSSRISNTSSEIIISSFTILISTLITTGQKNLVSLTASSSFSLYVITKLDFFPSKFLSKCKIWAITILCAPPCKHHHVISSSISSIIIKLPMRTK